MRRFWRRAIRAVVSRFGRLKGEGAKDSAAPVFEAPKKKTSASLRWPFRILVEPRGIEPLTS